MVDTPAKSADSLTVGMLAERLDGNAEAIRLLQASVDKMPTPALVQADLDALREITTERFKGVADIREAETRRLNELAAQKQTFDLELAKVLRANQDAASTLLATQLKEVKNDLSDRTAKLEQFRWETGGKTDVWRSIPVIIGAIIAFGGLAVAFFK